MSDQDNKIQEILDIVSRLNDQVEKLTRIVQDHVTNHPYAPSPKFGPVPTFPVIPFTPTTPIQPNLHQNGCAVCGLGVGPNGEAVPMGYVCSRNDCPSRISCQS